MGNTSRTCRKRTSTTYQRKLDRLKIWYIKIEEARKNWSEEKLKKIKPLKPLTWYVAQLKQPNK